MPGLIICIVVGIVFLFIVALVIAGRYRKCPSDRILVVFGKTGQGSAKCIHGGATFIWPIIQDYGFLPLRPLQIEVNLNNALCKQNIRICVPSIFTVAISTNPNIMRNAAERLFGQSPEGVAGLAKDIIFGQLRLVIASLTIEEINSDRENFLREIEKNVANELNKIGLQLLNVNITDITDESGYIDAIGQRAAAEAINKAKVEVAEETRKGGIGEASARKEQRIRVSQLEAEAQTGEAGAERDRRIAVKQADATAVDGENSAAIEIAKSNATRQEAEAEAYRRAEAAQKVAMAMIEKAQFEADEQAQISRAKLEVARQRAEIVVAAEIDKQKIEIEAEAEAEKRRREARGEADAIYARYDAEARGNLAILNAKAEGFKGIVGACAGNADSAAKMLIIEKLEDLVKLQAEAIKNIKIDKVTVWDSGAQSPDGKNSTANFLSGMVKSLPALHDVAGMAGLDLPKFLGEVQSDKAPVAVATEAEPTDTATTPNA